MTDLESRYKCISMKVISINHNGFHGHNTVRLKIPVWAKPGDDIEVSDRVAKRLNDAVCSGGFDCKCGESIAQRVFYGGAERFEFILPQEGKEIQGNYPQD